MRMAVLRSSFLTLAFLSGLPTLIKMGSWVVFLIPFLVGLGLDVHAALGFCNCLALPLAAFALEWPGKISFGKNPQAIIFVDGTPRGGSFLFLGGLGAGG
jgi:hypothetical protein